MVQNYWLQQKNADKKIEEILYMFDFDMVRKAIKLLELPYKIEDMESHARSLLEKVAREPDWAWIGVDIGYGFTAEKLPNGELVLHFAIELCQTGI